MPTAPIVWTPSAAKARARTLHAAVSELGNSVRACDGQDVDPALYAAWREWVSSWVAYWSGWSDAPMGTGWFGAAVATIERFELELEQWRGRWVRVCGADIMPPPQVVTEVWAPSMGALQVGAALGVGTVLALLFASRR